MSSLHCCGSALQKKGCRPQTKGVIPGGLSLAIFKPVSQPSLSSPCICEIKASVRMINMKGDSGSPWRIPLVGLILSFGSPLISTLYETEEIHRCIQEIHRSLNPSLRISASRKDHSIRS